MVFLMALRRSRLQCARPRSDSIWQVSIASAQLAFGSAIAKSLRSAAVPLRSEGVRGLQGPMCLL